MLPSYKQPYNKFDKINVPKFSSALIEDIYDQGISK